MDTQKSPGSSLDAMLARASQRVRLADPLSIASQLQDYLVIDVREPAEVLQGYLPGALNVPRGTLEFQVTVDSRFRDRQQPILIYSGDGRRSALAAETLLQLGYRDVQSLDGGIHQWSKANLPIE